MESTKLSKLFRFGARALLACAAAMLGKAACAVDTFTESPHTFTEESIEYTVDLRIGDGGKTMYVTNNTTAITVGSSKNFAVGAEANGIGSYVQNGGSLNVSSGKIYLGRNSGGTGYFELNGGSVYSSGIAYFGSKGGMFTGKMTGGDISVSQLFMAEKDSGADGAKATFTQSGGSLVSRSWFIVARTDEGTFTLDGGVVTNQSNRMVIGCFSPSKGAMTVNNGEVYSAGGITIAEKSGSEGLLEINGGTVYSRADALVGENGKGTLTIGGTGVFECQTANNGCLWLKLGVGGSSDNTINLNESGELKIWHIEHYKASTGSNVINFNGGTMTSLGNNGGTGRCLIGNYESGNTTAPTVRILEKGGIINTAKFVANIERATLESGVEEEQTDGGLTITGKGILNLNAVAAYNGLTYVESGVLALTNGYAFAGPVKVGKNGAIAVDITAANRASALAVDSKIALFSFKGNALGFDETTDTLDTSVFLTGPVVGYALSQETAEGVTTVYARITDVANINKTRKVTTFIAGPLSEGGDRHVDQDTAFSNKMPGGDGFDVVVFPGDALMYIWTGNNGKSLNFKPIGDCVVRGGTVWVKISNNDLDHSPRLGARHIAGNGTLKLTQVGLEAVDNMSGTLVVEPTVNVDFTCHESKPTYDTWITGHTVVDIKGDVYVTNGVLRVYSGAVFDGDVVVGPWGTMSWLNNPATVNGRLVVQEGATFNFNNQSVTFGENATIVLGGEIVNYGNVQSWPKTEIENGFYVYGTAPIANEDCTVKGGLLRVSPTKDGDNETLNLGKIKIPEGVEPANVLVVTDTQYNWTFTVDSSTRIVTATQGAAKTDADANVWYGGAEGDLSNGQNWSRGVPTATQTVKFISDAVVKRSDKNQTQYWKQLVLEGGVVVELKSNDGDYPNYTVEPDGISGTGTLVLRRCGLKAVDNSTDFAIPATITLVTCNNGGSMTEKDSWLNDEKATATITVNGPVTNKNYFVTRGNVVFNEDVTIASGAQLKVHSKDNVLAKTTFNKRLVFENGGSLTLDGANASVAFAEGASVEVLAGTASVPRSALSEGSSVSIASDAAMQINMNGEDEPVEENVAVCLGVAFSGDVANVSFSDSRAWAWTASVGQDGKLYATPKSTYQNHWVGGESGLWNSDANWEFGIPKMTECAVFTNSATATATENGAHKMDKLIIEAGMTVKFTAQTNANWPQLNMTEFPAGGTLEIGFGGIESYDGKELALNGDITLTNDGTRDAFIKAKNGRIVINGKLTITGESTKANILGQNNMLINGEIALDTSTENRNVRITRARVDGNITGSGYIQLDSDDGDKQCSLNGDNRGFSGRIDKINNNGCILGVPNAAGTNIEWHVTGDLHLVAENDQVWKFGALNFDWTGWNVCYITKGKSITLEVGSLGQDMTFKNAYKFWGEGANTDITVTIRKVGAGKLTTGAYNYKHLIVEAGEVALEKPTAFDNRNFKNINSVSVASGATISGYPGTQADGGMYIEALILAPGAIVKETLVATTENDVTTYSCPVLTATGDVDVSGVKFVLEDPNSYLNTLEYNETTAAMTFPVLSARSITGSLSTDEKIYLATHPWFWMAVKSGGNSVVFTPGRISGMMIIFQ
ncbi:MAG: hypothetical protein E7049_04930 [Lentisphaerae bacterium]|nr:hypothetical protein [Lentisphaerota bacterium]